MAVLWCFSFCPLSKQAARSRRLRCCSLTLKTFSTTQTATVPSCFCGVHGQAQNEFITSIRFALSAEGAACFKKKDWTNVKTPIAKNACLNAVDGQLCAESFWVRAIAVCSPSHHAESRAVVVATAQWWCNVILRSGSALATGSSLDLHCHRSSKNGGKWAFQATFGRFDSVTCHLLHSSFSGSPALPINILFPFISTFAFLQWPCVLHCCLLLKPLLQRSTPPQSECPNFG